MFNAARALLRVDYCANASLVKSANDPMTQTLGDPGLHVDVTQSSTAAQSCLNPELLPG
jgi:hypothetical protein